MPYNAVLRAVTVAALLLSARSVVAQVSPVPPAGPRPFATLLCKFADFPNLEPASRQHFDQIMASPTYPSVAHYWTEVGNGQFSLAGSRVFGWYVLPHPSAHYVGTFTVNYAALEQDCIAAADADVHFPDFHGINFVVNGSIGGTLTAGAVTMDRDGVQKQYVSTYLDASIVNAFGLAAHEIGHTFGLGHTSGPYGATYDSNWDVMSSSAWFPIAGTEMRAPAHINAYQKRYLGLIPAARVRTAEIGTTTVTLERHALPANNDAPLMVVVPVPGSYTPFNPAPYYILELRGGPGSGYDSAFPDPVVVMHYVHPLRGITVVDVDSNGDPNDAGASWVAGETFVDRTNDITISFDEHIGTTMRLTVRVGDRNVIAVTPASRRREIAFADSRIFADSADVVLTGPTASSAAWRAAANGPARRMVVGTPAGTGSARLRFTVNATQLAAGTHVDTVSISTDDAVNRVVHLVDTLVIAAPASLAVGVVPANRIDSLLTGQTRTLSALVRPAGPGADTVTWTAARGAPWIELLNGGVGSGTGSVLQWRHDASALAPGLYVDTIAVTLSNAATAMLVDTLRVLARPSLSLNRHFGAATLPQQSGPRIDSLLVSITGEWSTGAALTSLGVISPNVFLAGDPRPPTGGGWVRIRRDPGVLAPGSYMNRLRIALAMDAAQFVEYEDTLHVQATATRLTLSATSARDTILPGASETRDSVMVRPEGPNALSLKWESRANFAKTLLLPRNGSLPYGSGTGHQWLVWARNTSGDGPGVYVDTIWVRFATLAADSVRLIDTLVIAGPPPLVVGATSRHHTTIAGSTAAIHDSASVAVPAGIAWSATSRRPWTSFVTGAGTGDGMLRWRRDPATLAAGVHVDTISVTASGVSGSPHRIVDSLHVWPALVIHSDTVRAGVMGASYADTLSAAGASGTHLWSVASGALPPGLALAPTTGVLSGTPTQRGEFHFTARVTSDTFFVQRAFTMTVGIPLLASTSVLDQLLGGNGLTPDQRNFLDLQGNGNGRVDIGDVRAWLMSSAAESRPAAPDSAGARLRALTGARR